MNGVAFAGRIVFSFMFFSAGFNHLRKRDYMSDYAQQMGVPYARIAVPLSGFVLIAGSAMVVAGIRHFKH